MLQIDVHVSFSSFFLRASVESVKGRCVRMCELISSFRILLDKLSDDGVKIKNGRRPGPCTSITLQL